MRYGVHEWNSGLGVFYPIITKLRFCIKKCGFALERQHTLSEHFS